VDIKTLAALIEIRTYAVLVRENKNVFRGENYKAINSKIIDLDELICDEVLKLDLNNRLSLISPKVKLEENYKPLYESVLDDIVLGEKQLPLHFVSDNSNESKEKILDEDDILIAKRVAEEKLKIAERKSGKSKSIKKSSEV
jgi:hypothetical protein